MIPALPIETTDHIIDDLHDDLDTLFTCSLVSSSWRPRAQLYIFRDVDMTRPRVHERLPRALEAAPRLAAHIRTLHLPLPLPLYGPRYAAFLAHCPLPMVTALTLCTDNWYERLMRDDVPVLRLSKAFPGVRELTVLHAQFVRPSSLLALLHAFPHLDTLHLGRVFIRSVLKTAWTPVTLASLSLDDCTWQEDGLGSNGGGLLSQIRSLRRLRVHAFYFRDLAYDVGVLAARLADSLEELVVEDADRALKGLKLFASAYAGERWPALRKLCLRSHRSGDLVQLVQLVRDIRPDETTRVTLACAAYQLQWRELANELTRAPFPWKCAVTIDGLRSEHLPHEADVCATLDAMGLTIHYGLDEIDEIDIDDI